MAWIAFLATRGVVQVAGEDARKLLQSLITTDMDRLDEEPAAHAGLLSPQGKILFEFFVIKNDGGYMLDTSRSKADELVKRLTLYKLRAKVRFENVSNAYAVAAIWGQDEALHAVPQLPGALSYPDPRDTALGQRMLIPAALQAEAMRLPQFEQASEADYHAHRIAVGVPEAEMDFVLGDTFPHEAGFDLLGGVAFDKGCFVGQEVVSRVQHRGSARKRFVIVRSEKDLPPSGTEISFAAPTGRAVIGAIGSTSGRTGLALVRLDRASEALQSGLAFEAGGENVTLEAPPWASYALSPHSGAP